jgi:hypothetical protein
MVTMRYHGAVAAAMAGAGVVTLAFSPKLDALAADLGPACRHVPAGGDGLSGLPGAVEGALGARGGLPGAVSRLRGLAGRNVDVLDDLLAGS